MKRIMVFPLVLILAIQQNHRLKTPETLMTRSPLRHRQRPMNILTVSSNRSTTASAGLIMMAQDIWLNLLIPCS
ncbi:MAG: hypothetical protein B6D58_03255 [candidate division Zixibacteria bacterium 4484_95]|nr:MAG: hypothetical protein B6D58_03255 [candidate division Zixibacteria bacterium 4484_95]